MSGRIKRDASGQFAAGQSGNPNGARLRKPKELMTPSDLSRIAVEVASEIVAQNGSKPVTRYEAVFRRLARGDAANRLASRDFLELTRSASFHLENVARREAAQKPDS